jgi:hypothetical protein
MIAMTIAVTTNNPAIYLPLAAVNHFLLDAFPHFGFPADRYPGVRKKLTWPMVISDAIVGTSLFFFVLAKTEISFWLLFGVCFLAGWPDLLQLYRRQVNPKILPRFSKFHESIQTESPWLLILEAVTVVLCLMFIMGSQNT